MKLTAIKQISIGLLVSISTSLLLTAEAAPILQNRNSTETKLSNNDTLLIAQIRNYCREYESLFVTAETRDYWVSICGGDNPGYYVGVNKQNGDSIRVPLRDYDLQGDYFEAINGDVSYLLIRGTAKGDFLTVTQGTRELLRQPILNWN